MPSHGTDARLHDADRVSDQAQRQLADCLIDEMGEQSFPASDPPAWGGVSARLDRTKPDAAPVQSARSTGSRST